ncbi:uncharacterized protein LOC106011491 [Aplysia californica]|uniref:Uncharacterized protein LOC106011491 n=1 Tax=Aplysia californica TaxID=6500 RepID=A0ABM0ZY34_APLCA|nr:uncharacterized protein LOC106011491 [Aplysia californica]
MASHWTTVAVLACLGVVALAQTPTKPAFCKRFDCPLFTTETREGYEIRTYVSQNAWVSTSITSDTQDLNRRQRSSMFWKLFGYIRGNNAASKFKTNLKSMRLGCGRGK